MNEDTPTQKNDSGKIEDNFAQINEWEAKNAADRARVIMNSPEPAEDPPKWSIGQKIATAAGLTAALTLGLGIGVGVSDNLIPGDKVGSGTSTVLEGEGVQQAVDRDIKEIESQNVTDPADTAERQDVYSQAVHIHSDVNGIVQPGENITVIAEKSPVFGNITYKAVEEPAPDIIYTNEDGTTFVPDKH